MFFVLNLFWRQLKCNRLMLKMPFVRPVTKRFILRHTAAANGYDGPTLQTVFVALHVNYLKIAFYPNRSVIIYRKPCFAHVISFLAKVSILWQQLNSRSTFSFCSSKPLVKPAIHYRRRSLRPRPSGEYHLFDLVMEYRLHLSIGRAPGPFYFLQPIPGR